jgi:radical SAM protein (TIGR01212 family)
MASTIPENAPTGDETGWRAAGLRFHRYGFFLQQRFGHRVYKVSLDAGMTCPNVDGTAAVGGCVFCDNRSFSPGRRLNRLSLREQLEEGIRRVSARYECRHFLAYFQPATNTYAPVERLRSVYEAAIEHPQVVGLAIGTRPDCVPDDVLELIQGIAARTYVSLEYGLQTMHDRSLDWMNRGHHFDAFIDAMRRSRGRNFEVGAHVILGLPGETRDDMLATAGELARYRVNSVKLHNLYAVRSTRLAEQVAQGRVRLMERDEYVSIVADILELLPPTTVIERIGGDAPPSFLVAPDWCIDKGGLQTALQNEMERRDTWQGKKFHDRPQITA